MTNPLVSVIITTCNRAKYLPEAVASVQRQTYQPWELIIVDDGSSDETPQLLEEYAAQGIRCVRQENSGVSVARNHGLREAKGDFFAFLDDDDFWLDNKLEVQMAVMLEDPDMAVTYGHAEQFITADIDPKDRPHLEHLEGRVVPAPIATTMLARRSTFEQLGNFDESLNIGVEMDWYARLTEMGLKKLMLDDVMYKRRLHASNMNRATEGDQVERLRVLKQIIDRRRAAAREQEES